MFGKSRRIISSYFVSTLSISLVLIIVGMLSFIVLNARTLSNYVKQNIGFTVILKDNINDAEVKKTQKILDTKPFVTSSYYVSKEDAAQNLKNNLGEDFEDILGYNPLLPSIEIKLDPEYANNDSLAMIEANLMKYESVYEVAYQKSLVEYVDNNVRKISMVLLFIGSIFVIIAITLIRNTIHMSVYAKRFLIKTMQLVGAKPTFICKPFILSGFWSGFIGGVIANLVLLGAIYLLQGEVQEVIDIMNWNVLIMMVASVFTCGILLSLVSSWTSVYKYIRSDLNDLYV